MSGGRRKGARRRKRVARPEGDRAVVRGSRWASAARWIALAIGLCLACASTALFLVYPSARGPGQGRDVELVVGGGESPDDLARALSAAGLVSSPRLFALYVRATGGTSSVVAGVHLLTDDASPGELLARLERRASADHARVTFPEGWTRFDMARRLQDKHVVSLRSFLDATTDPALLAELRVDAPSFEGYLFPATYDLALDSDAREVVRRMKAEFDKRWSQLEARHQASLADVMKSAGMSLRDVVTLASMVEKEAATDEERATIASVFLNRLRDPEFKPKLLQCDPTAGYGCLVSPESAPSCAGYAGKITPAINNDPGNPYSTYKHEGLPPGPIANPGARSLEAAMAPAVTRYYYFVARGEGRHTFSESYDAHTAAIRDGGARR